MSKLKKSTIAVQGTSIGILSLQNGDFISLTDMVRPFEGGGALIEQWLKNKDTVLFLGVWERINNPAFNSLEFDGIRSEAGRNSFFLSAKKWIELTRAKGLIASAGRYGGTYAHQDIAFEFGSWLSPEFKLYLIREFRRLKDDENRRLSLAWNLNRTLSKLNYRIHTDAIKERLIPPQVTPAQAAITYANEADLLNVALFGPTARQWRDSNPALEGNMRDHASIEQLLVLANLEGMNAELIHMGLPQGERLPRLNQIAIPRCRRSPLIRAWPASLPARRRRRDPGSTNVRPNRPGAHPARERVGGALREPTAADGQSRRRVGGQGKRPPRKDGVYSQLKKHSAFFNNHPSY